MSYNLTNEVSSTPINSNVGYNNSWIHVENDANRELFAQASYITNYDDLSISLSAGNLNVNLGDVENLLTTTNLKIDATNEKIDLLNTRVNFLTGYVFFERSESSDTSSFSNTSQAEIKAANPKRISIMLYNEGPGNLYVRFASGTVSTASYSLKLAPSAYFENSNYSGVIRGFFDIPSKALVTQILAP